MGSSPTALGGSGLETANTIGLLPRGVIFEAVQEYWQRKSG